MPATGPLLAALPALLRGRRWAVQSRSPPPPPPHRRRASSTAQAAAPAPPPPTAWPERRRTRTMLSTSVNLNCCVAWQRHCWHQSHCGSTTHLPRRSSPRSQSPIAACTGPATTQPSPPSPPSARSRPRCSRRPEAVELVAPLLVVGWPWRCRSRQWWAAVPMVAVPAAAGSGRQNVRPWRCTFGGASTPRCESWPRIWRFWSRRPEAPAMPLVLVAQESLELEARACLRRFDVVFFVHCRRQARLSHPP
mmetsp:Transcript_41271/g.105109  ORF Transcript_41271/g.105109 Transcript_41271/m.105109 type:complete len:250 (+) Transcript_41271:864-1613(+)